MRAESINSIWDLIEVQLCSEGRCKINIYEIASYYKIIDNERGKVNINLKNGTNLVTDLSTIEELEDKIVEVINKKG